jgi:hypothetical protein
MGLWEIGCILMTEDIGIEQAIMIDSCDTIKSLKK